MFPDEEQLITQTMEKILKDFDKGPQQSISDFVDLSGSCQQSFEEVSVNQSSMHLPFDSPITGLFIY